MNKIENEHDSYATVATGFSELVALEAWAAGVADACSSLKQCFLALRLQAQGASGSRKWKAP